MRTASHLRAKQLAYAIFRHFVPRSRPHVARDSVKIRRRHVSAVKPILSNRALGGSSSLTFINYARSIAGGIDWHNADMPPLWRYHLHFFDYLADASRSDRWKRYTISDWLVKNPNPTNGAWEAYPVSLRIVNWVKFFERSETAIDEKWLQSLYDQALWLETNLERRVLTHHYLKNAKALLFAGTFFEGRDADRWRTRGLKIFVPEIREQFLGDGGHYERSPMYHMVCVEDLLDTVSLLQTTANLAPESVVELVRAKARTGLTFLDAILMPDGEIPLFNDAAFGIGPAPRELFAYGRALIDYKNALNGDSLSVTSLDASGYFVMRDTDDMLVIDCGLPGPSYQPGHGHSDCLTYELALEGQRLIVDTGVRDYDASSTRRYARSTRAHNTVSVDRRDQSEMWDVFRIGRRANPITPSLTMPVAGEAYFVGAHDGFRSFGNRLIHRRQVHHRGRFWTFEDCISGHGRHRIESRIHLAPGLVPVSVDGIFLIKARDGRLRAKITPSLGIAAQIVASPYFPRFGVTEMRNTIVFSLEATVPISLNYIIERPESQIDPQAEAEISAQTP